jgi:hypothetical protein
MELVRVINPYVLNLFFKVAYLDANQVSVLLTNLNALQKMVVSKVLLFDANLMGCVCKTVLNAITQLVYY